MELWSLFDFLMPGFLGTERQVERLFIFPANYVVTCFLIFRLTFESCTFKKYFWIFFVVINEFCVYLLGSFKHLMENPW